MRGVSLLVLSVLGACSTPVVTDRTFAICAPIRVDVAAGTADQLASLDEAIALWAVAGVSALVRDPAADVAISFEPGPPAEYGYYADGAAVINEALSGDAAAITIAHELGHAFGLVHTTTRPSVMNPGNLAIAPSADDRAAIAPCE